MLLLRRRPFPIWLHEEAILNAALEKGSTPPGTKWITVHPDGKDEPGRPVLIKESATQPGVYHIIGGAGGTLNHKRIDHLDPEKWAQNKKDNAAKQKEKVTAAKARGDILPEDEEQFTEAKKKNQRAYVDAVAKKLGWGSWHKDAADFVREGMTPGAARLASHRHLQSYVTKAQEAVNDLKERQRRDHDARDQAGLGNLSLDTNAYRATDAEIAPQHILEQMQVHQAQAEHLGSRSQEEAGDEADAIHGIADTIDRGGEDFDPSELPLPRLPEARSVLAELQGGNVEPGVAAQALRGLADALGKGDLTLPSGEQAAAAAGAASLFQKAYEATQVGDDDEARRYVEEAKKAAGDRGVTALDIIGKKQSEGRGYKPVDRQKARADIVGSGSTNPEDLTQRIKETNERLGEAQSEGEGPGVLDAIQLQREAYQRAHESALEGDHDKAADYIIQAEKYLVNESQHQRRSPKGQAMVLAAREKIRSNNAEVREAKAEGRVGAAGLDPDVADMADVKDLIVAQARFKEREGELNQAKRQMADDPAAFRQIVGDDERIKMEERDPEREDEIVRAEMQKVQEAGDTAVHAELLDVLDDPNYFASIAGGSQVSQGALDKYVGMGGHAMLNVLGQVVGGSEFLDRPTLDQLGVKPAARMVADYLANTRDPREVRAILKGLESYHVGRAADVASGALVAAQECIDRATDFELRGVKNSYDLSEMQKYNELRMKAVNQAMASVGSAYGELNMCAEMIWALGNARAQSDHSVKIDGGNKDTEGLVTLSHALGLREGEFAIVPPKVDRETKAVTPGALHLTGDGVRKVVKERPGRARAKALRLARIKAGGEDKNGWLPKGIAHRPADTWSDPELKPDRFDYEPEWKNLRYGEGASGHAALRDYAGNAIANGKPSMQVYHDLLKHPEMTDAGGYASPAWESAVNGAFGLGANDFDHELPDKVEAGGGALAAAKATNGLDRQRLDSDASVVEAAHRTLAQHPYGLLAHKGVADLTAQQRGHLRDYFYKHILGEPTPAENKAGSAAEGDEGIIHDTAGNPKDTQDGGEKWDKFVQDMGDGGRPGQEAALRAVLEHVKGETMRLFAQNYGQVSGKQLATGSGRFTDQGKLAAALGDKAPAARPTLGKRAEGTLNAMWGKVADNFTPGKPVKMMPGLSMDGRFINQQRAVKAIRDQRRIAGFLGVGSGKTLVSLSAFTDAHLDGQARASLFAVPQNMQGQFGAEAATYIDPNSGIKWHARPGQNAADRAKAMSSKDSHIHVTTHQSLRDDSIKALADADFKGDTKKAEEYMMTQPREMRKRAIMRAFQHRGWEHRLDYFSIDEGHEALNRKGKEDSLLARVMDGISDNAKHYVPLTGTPVKNDPSEAYDWLQKIDPENHTDEGREDFLRSFDGLTALSARIDVARRGQKARGAKDPKRWNNIALAEAVQRAVSPYFYATRVPLKSRLIERNHLVSLSPEHQAIYDKVTEDAAKANAAKSRGDVDVAAIKRLSPDSFKDLPAAEHAAHAQKLSSAIGVIRETAYNRALHGQDEHNSKLDAVSDLVKKYGEQTNKHGTKGKAGIIFASNLDAVHQITKRLQGEGHRVIHITGEDSAADKERKKLLFQPGDYKTNGEKNAKADVLVCSDAVSAGADLPRGEYVMHYDLPDTAKTHEQRTARAHRLSNDSDVEMTNIISNTPHEAAKRFRLANKYALADVFQNPAENMDDSGLQKHINDARERIALGAVGRRMRRRAAPPKTGTIG